MAKNESCLAYNMSKQLNYACNGLWKHLERLLPKNGHHEESCSSRQQSASSSSINQLEAVGSIQRHSAVSSGCKRDFHENSVFSSSQQQ
jgi:hypothetical protein